jgi:hypothetical protein
MASEFEEREVRTNVLHREVNERIRDVAAELFEVGEQEELWLVCECLRLSCSERIELRADVYRSVRAWPARFIVLPGHEEPAAERVVERHPGYVVVEKKPAIVEILARAAVTESAAAEPAAGSSERGGKWQST